MTILGIETSCDETALSIIEIDSSKSSPQTTKVKILADNVLSQVELHKQYGGVFPNLAKREHGKNLTPLLKRTLTESGLLQEKTKAENLKLTAPKIYSDILQNIGIDFGRDRELLKELEAFLQDFEKPPIDLIAVTAGPGLEPCLWVGLNFAKALSVAWRIPVLAANHMEGHILVSLTQQNKIANLQFSILKPKFPALALLVSGGHTEMTLMRNWLKYEIVGKTRDDALGEAFDKVARILGLPYPGGPEISKLAELARGRGKIASAILPRPMLHSDNLNFSFSGLKTAVLYLVKTLPSPLAERTKMAIAREFEDAVTEVVVEKVKKAVELYGVKTLITGGGVAANKNIRAAFEKLASEQNIVLKLPAIDHATDNALMIALAGYFNRHSAVTKTTGLLNLKANGNLSFPNVKLDCR